jgi:CBS domain-containing protein
MRYVLKHVHEIMSEPVGVISPNTPSSEAAVLMRDENIGSLPVGENGWPSNTAVRTVMSQGLYCCFEDDTLIEAANVMAYHQVRRLPVLNQNGQLVGIIAMADIARTGYREAEATAIEGVSQPSEQPRH